MKTFVDKDGNKIPYYEDQQEGDSFSEFEENQSREAYFENVLDYMREPEERVVDDNPEEPKVVSEIRKLWQNSQVEQGFTPSNKEEKKEKLDLFWKTGKLLAEFYEKVGHARRQCPQCGWYVLENKKECGSNSDIYPGCGYEFNYTRDRGYSREMALERGLGFNNPEKNAKAVEEFGEEAEIEGIHAPKTIKKFKQFYWLFPDGNYSYDMTWFATYDFASYYNARVIVLPVYWDMVEEMKNGKSFEREERRERIRDAIKEYAKNPRENFLTKQKYKKYRE